MSHRHHHLLKKLVWRSVITDLPTSIATRIVLYRSRRNTKILDHAAWLSCKYGRLQLLRNLVHHQADINHTKHLRSTLDVAMMNGHVEIVQELLQLGVNVHTGMHPVLCRAAMYGHVNVVTELLTLRNKYTKVNEYQHTRTKTTSSCVTLNALPESSCVTLNSLPESSCVTLNSLPESLLIASKLGYAEVVEVLLNHGADSNSRSKSGSTAIQVAAASGHGRVVKLLRDHCADIHACTFGFPPPLHTAIKNNFTTVAKTLLEYNCGKHCRALCVALGLRIDYRNYIIYIPQSTKKLYQLAPVECISSHLLLCCLEFIVPHTFVADIHQEHLGVSPMMLAIKHSNATIAKLLTDTTY